MSEIIPAYPLQWPTGWKRASWRQRAKFSAMTQGAGEAAAYRKARGLTIADGRLRVLTELRRMGLADFDVVISSDVPLRLDGMMRGDAREPRDPGVAVYWRKGKATRCMAIDRYDRVADNLAAIAATLEAMRAIERHGGAEILDRAFTGFTALPAPEQWFQVLGVTATATRDQIEAAYRRLAMVHHPDHGGTTEQMTRINLARDEGLAQATA